MTDIKHQIATKLLWIDLEMTGLDPLKDRILEVAVIVTDFNFKEIACFESAVFQKPVVLKNMNNWSAIAHKDSGLIDRVKIAPKESEVVALLLDFIKSNFNEPAVLAGNSVHIDRSFIKQWWPEIETKLHYRMMDVSSFKIIMQGKYKAIYKKKEAHLALSDIKESIAELKFYLDLLKRHK